MPPDKNKKTEGYRAPVTDVNGTHPHDGSQSDPNPPSCPIPLDCTYLESSSDCVSSAAPGGVQTQRPMLERNKPSMLAKKKNCLTCPISDCLLQLCRPTFSLSDPGMYRQQFECPRGTVVFRQGDPVRGVYLIQSGLVKMAASDPGGRSLILGIGRKGDPMGHHGFNSSATHSHTAVAMEDASVCIVEKEHFKRLWDDCIPLRERVFHIMDREMRENRDRLMSMAHRSVRSRIASTLLYICGLYGYAENGRGIRVHFDRQDMADHAGTTKEQVSKVLSDFKRKGLVNFRAKHFKHFDLAGLAELSGNHDGTGGGEDGLSGAPIGVKLPEVA